MTNNLPDVALPLYLPIRFPINFLSHSRNTDEIVIDNEENNDSHKTTWRTKITVELENYNESWSDVESCTLTEEELDEKFYDGFGGSEGEPFTLWTKNRVYFPWVYDGREGVESVSRNPDGKPTEHIGGE